MNTIVNTKNLTTLADIEAFLNGTEQVAFIVNGTKDERYQSIENLLKQHRYRQLGKRDRGLIRRFIQRITGYSRATLSRLIRQYLQCGQIRRKRSTANGFQRRYTDADIRLLAEMDQLHHTPNGYAMKRLCERAYVQFGELPFERLAHISVAHLYRLRASPIYGKRHRVFRPTRNSRNTIGQRRAPCPNSQPGYLRVDSVHQGNLDKRKGLYHINAVDQVTQYQIIVTVQRISERFMIPALQYLIDQFPFRILGFHADNGSEYINYQVAALLKKLLIDLTKSRPRKSNDNALVESKNGSVVRKLFGHHYIPQHFAQPINDFNQNFLNPHLNFHRPCLYATTITNQRGQQKKQYPYALINTPYEKLKSLPQAHTYLKPGVTFDTLDLAAYAISDNQSAQRLNSAYQDMNQLIHESGHHSNQWLQTAHRKSQS